METLLVGAETDAPRMTSAAGSSFSRIPQQSCPFSSSNAPTSTIPTTRTAMLALVIVFVVLTLTCTSVECVNSNPVNSDGISIVDDSREINQDQTLVNVPRNIKVLPLIPHNQVIERARRERRDLGASAAMKGLGGQEIDDLTNALYRHPASTAATTGLRRREEAQQVGALYHGVSTSNTIFSFSFSPFVSVALIVLLDLISVLMFQILLHTNAFFNAVRNTLCRLVVWHSSTKADRNCRHR